jgi:hypothetical protein
MLLWDKTFDPVLGEIDDKDFEFYISNEIVKLILSNKSFTDVPHSTHEYMSSLANFEIDPNSIKLEKTSYSIEIKEVKIKRHFIPPKTINFNVIKTTGLSSKIGGSSYNKIILSKESI